MEFNAEQARLRPLGLAVPETCSVRRLALLDAAARDEGTVLDVRSAGPAERAELLRAQEVRAALVAVPPAEADWVVPLGVAARSAARTGPLHLDTLRPARGTRAYQRIWIQPEDDVPHVRDRLEQAGHRAALVPAQVTVAPSLVAAVAETMRTDGLLLCSAAQADELGLRWRRLADDPVARGYAVSAASGDDAGRILGALRAHVGRALGAREDAFLNERRARTSGTVPSGAKEDR
jgi:hypothetical protein